MASSKTKPSSKAAPVRPEFAARFSGGDRSARNAFATEKVAAVMPENTRKMNSTQNDGVIAMMAWPVDPGCGQRHHQHRAASEPVRQIAEQWPEYKLHQGKNQRQGTAPRGRVADRTSAKVQHQLWHDRENQADPNGIHRHGDDDENKGEAGTHDVCLGAFGIPRQVGKHPYAGLPIDRSGGSGSVFLKFRKEPYRRGYHL